MPRRRKGYLSDESSDSNASEFDDDNDALAGQDEDPDLRAERELFEGHGYKRRRKMGKVDREQAKASAWEGIFGSEGEDDDYAARRGGRTRGGRAEGSSRGSKRFTAPSFVSSNAQKQAEKTEEQDEDDSEASDQQSDTESSDASAPSRPDRQYPNAGIDEDDDEEHRESSSRPRFGGIAMGKGGIGSGSTASATRSFASSFSKGSSAPKDAEVPDMSSAKNLSDGTSRPGAAEGGGELSGIGTSVRHQIEGEQDDVLNAVPPAESDAGGHVPSAFGKRRAAGLGWAPPPSTVASTTDGTPGPASPEASASKAARGSLLHGGSRPQRAFIGKSQPTDSAPKASSQSITADDMRHLQSIKSSFGAKLLAKQGWAPGKGLGADESGKAVPIQANIGLRRGQGIGKGVRTEQSKRDAKAKGEKFSSDEEDERRKSRRKKGDRADSEGGATSKGEKAGWKQQRKLKVKVEHKTYEELLAEAGDSVPVATGLGKVLDARGGEPKEVANIADLSLSSWTPTSDKTQLPELRHNLKLIVDSAQADVINLAREGKGVNEKRAFALREKDKLIQILREEETKITNLKAVQAIVDSIKAKISQISPQSRRPLEALTAEFSSLLQDYRAEYDEYDLDDIVVGVVSQLLQSLFDEWEPLASSDDLLANLLPLKRAFRFSEPVESDALAVPDSFSGPRAQASEAQRWLPKVRSALNNEWEPSDPEPAVRLVTEWQPLLPRFVFDNALDQLIIPKIRKQVKEWNPRLASPGSLAAVLFPWLPVLGFRAEELLDEAKLQIGDALKRWSPKDVLPKGLSLWKDMFSTGKWDTLILLHVLPKLAMHMDANFEVDPREQDMGPLNCVLGWSRLMRESTLTQLLEEKFFPKWLDTLHFWLIQPNYDPGEVTSWYQWWKNHFAQFLTSKEIKLSESPGIEHGFRYGLKLMNEAVALGNEASKKLAAPDFKPLPNKKSKATSTQKPSKPRASGLQRPNADQDISFRTIAEQHAVEHNLFFVATGRSDTATGNQLFKVSKNVDGRGGITVFVANDAVYALGPDSRYRAVLLDDMIKLAEGTSEY